jgi:hypothetical protein
MVLRQADALMWEVGSEYFLLYLRTLVGLALH